MLEFGQLLDWSPWLPLEGAWLGPSVPSTPGLYRIRHLGEPALDYLGQTGAGTMTLKKRLGMLRGVYGEQMPYRDPHTAAPALWALRQLTERPYEVSVVSIEGSTPWRKGLEALAIGLYRQEHRRSPTVNFGRMPEGYRMSSGNNLGLVRAGRLYRGGATLEQLASHAPSLAPVGTLTGDPHGPDWCGHNWSGWAPVSQALRDVAVGSAGLYRLRDPRNPGLLYVGQGKVRQRLAAHLGKGAIAGNAQGVLFGAGRLECSWVLDDSWLVHQRLELENDLIAAHVLATQTVPPAQFIG